MKKRYFLYLLCIATMVALDQYVKYLVVKDMELYMAGGYGFRIPNIVHMIYVENTGAFFGMLANFRILFVIITPLALGLMGFIVVKNFLNSRLGDWGIVFVIGGALGNFIDRAANGYVVDFFELEFMRFAIFNVADLFITIGGILLVVCLLFTKEKPKERVANEPVDTDSQGGV